MARFLMCEPEYFTVSYVINPWMEGNLGQVDREGAHREWNNLRAILAARAEVSLVEPVENLPDMVFTANAALVHGKRALVSSFRHPERQGEEAHFAEFFAKSGLEVLRMPPEVNFEGAGDALFDADGRLWLGHGFRSDPEAARWISRFFAIEAEPLRLVDARWYHLDTCFCPLEDGQVLAYQPAFSEESAQRLQRIYGERLIWVSTDDAENFACNAISIGKEVILHRASARLRDELGRRGLRPVEAEMSEFMKAGGACKCLTLRLP